MKYQTSLRGLGQINPSQDPNQILQQLLSGAVSDACRQRAQGILARQQAGESISPADLVWLLGAPTSDECKPAATPPDGGTLPDGKTPPDGGGATPPPPDGSDALPWGWILGSCAAGFLLSKLS